jgi:hypothetical protein
LPMIDNSPRTEITRPVNDNGVIQFTLVGTITVAL